jgi:hypothetical protein
MEAHIRGMYQLFLDTVAAGRKSRGITSQRADELGRGRIWTGAQALDNRLVDKLGGFSDALDEAARRGDVELGPGGVPELVVLPRQCRLRSRRCCACSAWRSGSRPWSTACGRAAAHAGAAAAGVEGRHRGPAALRHRVASSGDRCLARDTPTRPPPPRTAGEESPASSPDRPRAGEVGWGCPFLEIASQNENTADAVNHVVGHRGRAAALHVAQVLALQGERLPEIQAQAAGDALDGDWGGSPRTRRGGGRSGRRRSTRCRSPA